tara:strand:- start:445 stop:930 length:486 start_codon:yes stop_codon:yes gene_type:complete
METNIMNTTNQVKLLSNLGLIPFLFLSFGAWFLPYNVPYETLCLSFFFYALMINSFLSGNLWGYSLEKKINPFIPIIFFFLPILFFLVVILLTYQAFQLEASLGLSASLSFMLLFSGIYLYEKRIIKHEDYYSLLRLRLSTIVIICHLSWVIFFANILRLT